MLDLVDHNNIIIVQSTVFGSKSIFNCNHIKIKDAK